MDKSATNGSSTKDLMKFSWRNALLIVICVAWTLAFAIHFAQIVSWIHAFNGSIQAALSSWMPPADDVVEPITDGDVALFLFAWACICAVLASVIRNAWTGASTH